MKRENGNNRLNRINEELKREISNIINYEVTNSNVTGMVSVTSGSSAMRTYTFALLANSSGALVASSRMRRDITDRKSVV